MISNFSNIRRVADVWMDEYAKFIWERRPDFKNSDPGDVSDQVDEAQKIFNHDNQLFWWLKELNFRNGKRNAGDVETWCFVLGVSALSFTMQVFQVVYERSGLGSEWALPSCRASAICPGLNYQSGRLEVLRRSLIYQQVSNVQSFPFFFFFWCPR